MATRNESPFNKDYYFLERFTLRFAVVFFAGFLTDFLTVFLATVFFFALEVVAFLFARGMIISSSRI